MIKCNIIHKNQNPMSTATRKTNNQKCYIAKSLYTVRFYEHSSWHGLKFTDFI